MTEFGNSLQILKSKLSKGLMDGKGISRVSPVPGIDSFEVEFDNGDLYLLRIARLINSVVYPLTYFQEINRGSPSFKLNSIELEIETAIRMMVRICPMKRRDIQNELKNYNKSDVAHVIKHSKGLNCSISDVVYYREWVSGDVEMDVGV